MYEVSIRLAWSLLNLTKNDNRKFYIHHINNCVKIKKK
jgi:hypothetical protein